VLDSATRDKCCVHSIASIDEIAQISEQNEEVESDCNGFDSRAGISYLHYFVAYAGTLLVSVYCVNRLL
jgi:hypothetical protein